MRIKGMQAGVHTLWLPWDSQEMGTSHTQKHPLFVPHRIAYSSELSHRWQDENGEREKGDHHFLATLSPKDGQFRDNAFTDICLRWGGEDTHVTTEGYKVIVLARALLSAASKTCTQQKQCYSLAWLMCFPPGPGFGNGREESFGSGGGEGGWNPFARSARLNLPFLC